MAENKLRGRRKSRVLALTALYINKITEEDINSVLGTMKIEENPSVDIFNYTKRIVHKTKEEKEQLDKLIKEQCVNWDLDRLTVIDVCILYIGITEILFFDDVPFKVSIDEAIEIAKDYSTDKSGKFINGILDPIANNHKNRFKE